MCDLNLLASFLKIFSVEGNFSILAMEWTQGERSSSSLRAKHAQQLSKANSKRAWKYVEGYWHRTHQCGFDSQVGAVMYEVKNESKSPLHAILGADLPRAARSLRGGGA